MKKLNTEQPVIEQSDHIPQLVIEQCNHIPQLLSIKDVGSYTGLSRSTIYEMINEKSDRYDPTFPKKVQLTQVRVVWVASEISEWVHTKMAQRSA